MAIFTTLSRRFATQSLCLPRLRILPGEFLKLAMQRDWRTNGIRLVIHGPWLQDQNDLPIVATYKYIDFKALWAIVSKDFNADELDLIDEVWPSYVYPQEPYQFILREWAKHGVTMGLTPTDYIKLALELYSRIPMGMGIPKIAVPLSRIFQAVSDSVDAGFFKPATPEIVVDCTKTPFVVDEVRNCFDHNLVPVNCKNPIVGTAKMTDLVLLP